MKGNSDAPKVFISYSWTDLEHENWVIEFAQRLYSDGIIAVLDKWDLKDGQDKHVFMEKMVNDSSIKKVLVICDRGYQEKADDRRGGVGTESQLISKEVYENVAQEKFIPIVKEFDENNKPCVPQFMGGRKYIDLSNLDTFEDNYQYLVRNLYDKPLYQKPSLGTIPAYISQEDPIVLKTARKVLELKKAIEQGRKVQGLVNDYLDTFKLNLEDFAISKVSERHWDDQVYESIQNMLPLRDDFIDFLYVIYKHDVEIDIEVIHSFLESLAVFFSPRVRAGSWQGSDFDNYKFFLYELMLYTVAILLKFKRYSDLGTIVTSRYMYSTIYNDNLQNKGIELFNAIASSLDIDRNKRLQSNRASITADLIKERATRKDITFNDVKQADLILYYLTVINKHQFAWFPHTSVYNEYGKIELFSRLISVKHFHAIKYLFGVNNIDELKQIILSIDPREQHNHLLWERNVLPINIMFNVEGIGLIH